MSLSSVTETATSRQATLDSGLLSVRFELVKRAELTHLLHRRRCAECGFLGAIPLPDSSRELGAIGEVTAIPRQQWMPAQDAEGGREAERF
jgi:hypothetical protein